MHPAKLLISSSARNIIRGLEQEYPCVQSLSCLVIMRLTSILRKCTHHYLLALTYKIYLLFFNYIARYIKKNPPPPKDA